MAGSGAKPTRALDAKELGLQLQAMKEELAGDLQIELEGPVEQ